MDGITYINSLSDCKGDIFRILIGRVTRQHPETISLLNSEKFSYPNFDYESMMGLSCSFDGLGLDENQIRKCVAIVLDAEYQRELKRIISSCHSYSAENPVFEHTDLWRYINRKQDLVDFSKLSLIKNSNVARVGNKWIYIDPRIPLQYIVWLRKCFKNNHPMVRIDPDNVYSSMPPQALIECLVLPPQYRWWEKFSRSERHNGSRYDLLPEIDNTITARIEYERYNVRRLETSATWRENDYFNMLMEEISEINNPADSTQHYLFGRMIHLDSKDDIDNASIDNLILNHIDIAINIYEESADERMQQSLSNGNKIVRADYRTHLLRVENVPFKTLFKFAESFFRSKTLVAQWLETEFENIKDNN